MTCEHRDCNRHAEVKVRFGDGLTHTSGTKQRQTFVAYCFPCYQSVDRIFLLRDVKLLAEGA